MSNRYIWEIKDPPPQIMTNRIHMGDKAPPQNHDQQVHMGDKYPPPNHVQQVHMGDKGPPSWFRYYIKS